MADMSESIGELAAALSKVQAKIRPAAVNASNPFFHSKYADLASVWDACRDPLAANGLAVVQTMAEAPAGHVAVDTLLTHTSGQWVRGRLVMPLTKADPQAAGSAITYARRYSLAAIVGVVADEDDDANSATHGSAKPERHDNATGGGVSSPDRPTAAGRSPAPPPSPGDAPTCPKCKGDMWDNRADRAKAEAEIAAGTRTKKAPPAWKCKDKACNGLYWPSDPNADDKPRNEAPPQDAPPADLASIPRLVQEAKRAIFASMKAVGMPKDRMTDHLSRFLKAEYNADALDALDADTLGEVAARAYYKDTKGVDVQGIDWVTCAYLPQTDEVPF